MKKLNITALLLGAGLFAVMGATSLSAEGMKCGNGKCGGKSMEKPAGKKASKCGDAKNPAGKCGKDMKSSKCGDEKKPPKKSGKCGAGKCSG